MRFRISMLLVLAAVMIGISACSETTAPKATPQPDKGWTVVVTPATGIYNIGAVTAMRTNPFDSLTVNSFSTGSTVANLAHDNDTVWVGLKLHSGIFGIRDAHLGSKLSWSYSGSMALKKETDKLSMGDFRLASMQAVYTVTDQGLLTNVESSRYVTAQPLTVLGDAFHYVESIANDSSLYEIDHTVVIYRPVVCREEVTVTIPATSFTETFGDSARSYQFTDFAPEVKISCLRPAPEADRSPGITLVLGDALPATNHKLGN